MGWFNDVMKTATAEIPGGSTALKAGGVVAGLVRGRKAQMDSPKIEAHEVALGLQRLSAAELAELRAAWAATSREAFPNDPTRLALAINGGRDGKITSDNGVHLANVAVRLFRPVYAQAPADWMDAQSVASGAVMAPGRVAAAPPSNHLLLLAAVGVGALLLTRKSK